LIRELIGGLASQRGGVLLLADAGLTTDGGIGPEPFKTWIEDPDRKVLIGTLEGQACGIGMGHVDSLSDGRPLGHLDVCYVEPDARGVGVDGVALPGDREAKNFYEAAGFKARLLTMHRPSE
jgi:hypothetical protein